MDINVEYTIKLMEELIDIKSPSSDTNEIINKLEKNFKIWK
ncbi:MAG: hypothetical protein ACTHWZ_02305 [Peptoniphilaceae bacterium]